MRILHIGKYYSPHIGGTELYTQELVRHQSKSSTVSVIVSNTTSRTQIEVKDNAQVIRVCCLAKIASTPITPSLLTYIRRIKADIVHLHMPNPVAALAYLASRHTGKLIITHHCDTVGRTGLKLITDPVVRATMRKASHIIVTTKTYLDSSEELADFSQKCRVIPLGVDPSRFSNISEEQVRKIKEKYGPRILTCVGRFVTFKGFEYAIRALAEVPANLLLAGDGRTSSELRQLARDCGVADRVHFLGVVSNEEVPALLKASSVLLFPSIRRTESFGYSQLEAMAAGIPVINTSIKTGAPEVSVDGVTGFTIPPMNVQALACAARKLLDDDNLRQSFGRAGMARVRQNYTLEKMTSATTELYKEVLEAPSPVFSQSQVA